MNPFAIIALVMSALGTAASVSAARAKARFQSKVATANQDMAKLEAAHIQEVASQKAEAHDLKVRRRLATERAGMASSGFLVGEGSFGDILEGTDLVGNLDTLAIRHEGDLAVWREKERAKQLGAQSQYYSASNAGLGEALAGAGTLLTGLNDKGFFDTKGTK